MYSRWVFGAGRFGRWLQKAGSETFVGTCLPDSLARPITIRRSLSEFWLSSIRVMTLIELFPLGVRVATLIEIRSFSIRVKTLARMTPKGELRLSKTRAKSKMLVIGV